MSCISVVLILLDKWQRGAGHWRNLTFAALLTWALALIVIGWRFFNPSGLELWWAVLLGIAIVFAALVNLLVAGALGCNLAPLARRMTNGLRSPWRAFALMVIVAPVCEELLFRGFLLQLFARWGLPAAILIATALFVAAHLNLECAPHLIVAGLILGALASFSGGLATPIVAHAVANLLGFVALILIGQIWRSNEFDRSIPPTGMGGGNF